MKQAENPHLTGDYFVVLKDTLAVKKGTPLYPMYLIGQRYYGADRRNRFFTEKHLRGQPEIYEHVGDRNKKNKEEAEQKRMDHSKG